jgi:hypothetical protein
LKERLLEPGLGGDGEFSEEKLDYAIQIMHLLTEYYGVPQYFEDWATRLAARESLGPALGYCAHVGIVHQFQRINDHVPTRNGLVDWWLILIPHGVDFQALDALPIHVLYGLVDSGSCRLLSREQDCLERMKFMHMSPNDGLAISRMNRLEAARYLNRRLADALFARLAPDTP